MARKGVLAEPEPENLTAMADSTLSSARASDSVLPDSARASDSVLPDSVLPALGEDDGDPRWAAVVKRDEGCDGQFVYAVRTTGVYCRPACRSRLPRRRNVEFFLTCSAAEGRGYRACLKCNPRAIHAQAQQHARVAEFCHTMDQNEGPVPITALAQQLGLSPSRAARLFKEVTGVTATQYALARREQRLRIALVKQGRQSAEKHVQPRHENITRTVYACGYNSVGRFYARASQVLGMSPSRYRSFGEGETINVTVGTCQLGDILVAATTRGVCSVALGDDADTLMKQFHRDFALASIVAGDSTFDRWVALVVGFVQCGAPPKSLPLDIRGTVFQQRVWHLLGRIPRGQTRTYSDIARALGDAHLARAVASACAANRLAVVIPCHRVVRRDDSLSGYRWGVERKGSLLKQEEGPVAQFTTQDA